MESRLRLCLLLILYFAVRAGLAHASAYDTKVLADQPVLFLTMGAAQTNRSEPDLSGRGNHGRYFPPTTALRKARLPNGDRAALFDGFGEYLEVFDSPTLSIPPGGAFTFEAWIRFDTLEFPRDESDGYVHWAGKGESGNHEYALRAYSFTNTASPSRPNRISGYVFNREGGLGSGSYFQDPVGPRQWIHVALIVDLRAAPGTVSIYKNAQLRKATSLAQFGVVPQAGSAPLRLATRDFGSFFKGAIGKVAIYSKRLSDDRLRAHYVEMRKWRIFDR